MMDWFARTWNDFVDWLHEILRTIFQFFKDVFLDIFELLLDGIVFVFNSIQPPDFLANGLNSLFQNLSSDVVYFLGQSGLAEGLALYGAGVTFRLLRKLFTLGQW